MKITTEDLKKIILEEYQNLLKESMEERIASLERGIDSLHSWVKGITPGLRKAGIELDFATPEKRDPRLPPIEINTGEMKMPDLNLKDVMKSINTSA